ncbi:MAG: hypothetical protein ACI364_07390 [Coriobacteriales bacterium]
MAQHDKQQQRRGRTRSDRDVDLSADPWAEERRQQQADERRRIEHEHEEFDIDDLSPMSGLQKLLLFVVVLLVVAGAFYLMSLWFGF